MQPRICSALLACCAAASAFGAGVDPGNTGARYAWAENAGWLNFKPSIAAAQQPNVDDFQLTGYVWAENLGWINLSCTNSGACGGVNHGVTNNGLGQLKGYAWSENAGWISFSCANSNSCASVNYGVSINPSTGVFSGKAWGENLGWISFDPAGAYTGMVTGWRARDTDGDGVFDANDNCTLVANADQRDTNGDGFGNICDPDFNNNNNVDSQDASLLRAAFGSTAFPDRDLNGNGRVDSQDASILRARFGQPPGPKGLQ